MNGRRCGNLNRLSVIAVRYPLFHIGSFVFWTTKNRVHRPLESDEVKTEYTSRTVNFEFEARETAQIRVKT